MKNTILFLLFCVLTIFCFSCKTANAQVDSLFKHCPCPKAVIEISNLKHGKILYLPNGEFWMLASGNVYRIIDGLTSLMLQNTGHNFNDLVSIDTIIYLINRDGLLYKYSLNGHLGIPLTTQFKAYSQKTITSPNKELWGIGDKILYRYNPSKNTLKKYTISGLFNGQINHFDHLLFNVNGDKLYITSGKYIIEWNVDDDTNSFLNPLKYNVTITSIDHGLGGLHSFDQLEIESTTGLIYLIEDTGQSAGFVYKFDPLSKEFNELPQPSLVLSHLVTDKDGDVWGFLDKYDRITNLSKNKKCYWGTVNGCPYPTDIPITSVTFEHNSEQYIWVISDESLIKIKIF